LHRQLASLHRNIENLLVLDLCCLGLLEGKNYTTVRGLGTSMAQVFSGAETNATSKFLLNAIESQSFADYLEDDDTDAENETLPPSRRWA
jgi:hypothetical protein